MRYIRKKAAVAVLAAVLTAAMAAGTVSADESGNKTVYVITDANGVVKEVIDPARQENEDSFTDLPVDIRVSYELDGEAVSPQDLAGKSGHVIIRMEYENHTKAPFAVLTGMVLDSSVFSDLSVSGGKLMGDNGRNLVAGLLFPGLQDLLELQSEDISVPEELVVEADVTNFELDMVYSVAMTGLLDDLDESKLDQASTLATAVSGLEDTMADILTGAQDLSDGADNLNEGLSEIVAHNSELTDGAAQIFEALLSTVEEQVRSTGLEIEPLTIENYQEVLGQFDAEGIEEQARQQVEAQVDAMGDALYLTYLESQKEDILAAYLQKNADDVCKDVLLTQISEEQTAALTQEQLEEMLNQQLAQLSEEEKSQILEGARAQMTEEQIAQILTGALDTLSQEQKDQIREGAVEQGMESEEVQLQIQAAQQQAAPLQAALEQLDQYQTFYAGLISYTQGVQTAADGAETLDTGALSLKNGLTSFDTLGIQVLTDTVENKLQPLLDKGYELLEEDRNYHYQEETEGSVKFIYKMEAIGGLSE